MQFKVPQKIDIEDKILGPLSMVQFVYAVLGAGADISCLAPSVATIGFYCRPADFHFLLFALFLSRSTADVWSIS